MNAADDEKRAEALAEMAKVLDAEGRRAGIDVVMHSLAFGTLKPFLAADAGERISKPQMEMTRRRHGALARLLDAGPRRGRASCPRARTPSR